MRGWIQTFDISMIRKKIENANRTSGLRIKIFSAMNFKSHIYTFISLVFIVPFQHLYMDVFINSNYIFKRIYCFL